MVSAAIQYVGGILGLVAVVWTVYASIVIVNNTEQGVVTRSGEFKRVLDPGLHVIPPFGRTIATYPLVEMTGTQPCPVSTADDQPVDVVVQYRFEVNDVERVAGYQGWDDPDAWKRALSERVCDTTQAVVGDLDFETVVNAEETIGQSVKREMDRLAPALGISLAAVEVTEITARDRSA